MNENLINNQYEELNNWVSNLFSNSKLEFNSIEEDFKDGSQFLIFLGLIINQKFQKKMNRMDWQKALEISSLYNINIGNINKVNIDKIQSQNELKNFFVKNLYKLYLQKNIKKKEPNIISNNIEKKKFVPNESNNPEIYDQANIEIIVQQKEEIKQKIELYLGMYKKKTIDSKMEMKQISPNQINFLKDLPNTNFIEPIKIIESIPIDEPIKKAVEFSNEIINIININKKPEIENLPLKTIEITRNSLNKIRSPRKKKQLEKLNK